ncbi:MAG: hypothetical protein ACJ76Y_04910 [Thermoanaerobaculia bacterium]
MSSPTDVLKQLRIQVFDVHLHLQQVWDTTLLRPEVAFLVSRLDHARAYVRDGLPSSPDYAISPLGRELHVSRFWRHYRRLLPTRPGLAAPLPWECHLPFVFTWRRPSLEYKPAQTGLAATINASALLWPYGWSSNLEINLSGEITRDQVPEILEEVRSGTPFVVDGQPLDLAGTFRALTGWLKKALYQQPVQDSLPVKRRLVVSLLWEGAGKREGWDADWAVQAFPSPEEAAVATDHIRTRLKGSDFAVTFFQLGSLVSLSRRPSQSASTLSCASTNLRSFLGTAHTLLYFLKHGKQKTGESPELDGLLESGHDVLLALPEGYRNPLCEHFLTHHRLAKDLTV